MYPTKRLREYRESDEEQTCGFNFEVEVERRIRAEQVLCLAVFKLEFLAYFPNYEEMRFFIKDRTNGDLLQTHIMKAIDKVQSGYMKGKLNSTQAKQKLDKLD